MPNYLKSASCGRLPKRVWEVKFVDGSSVEQWAYTKKEATILAQADRIKNGLIYDVEDVKFLHDLED